MFSKISQNSQGNTCVGVFFLTKFQVSATATLLALPVPCWTGDNTDLRLESNILKTVRVNIALQKRFLKNIQSAF